MRPNDHRRTPGSYWGLALLAVINAEQALAQGQSTAVISGRVTSHLGQPLVTANVWIADLSVSVATNDAGRYTINLPAERVRGQTVTVLARAIGFKPDERLVTITAGSQTADFTLTTDVNRLDRVVVTGVTGATPQRLIPINVARLDASDMRVPGANALTQIAGKVPGAYVMWFSGRPGAQPDVLLRGPKMINALQRGQSPLFIVDGVIINGALPDLDSEDIESIEIVKGASAASIYGSRAGNGVIQITTKRGVASPDGTQFRLRTEYGAGEIPGEFRLATRHFLSMDESGKRFCVRTAGNLDCARTVDINEEALRINEQATGAQTLIPESFVNDFALGGVGSKQLSRGLFQVHRWPTEHDAIAAATTNSAYTTQYVDITGRSGNINYFLSASNLLQEAAFVSLDGFRRQSLRLNFDNQVNEWWRVGLTTFYGKSWTGSGNFESGQGGQGLGWLTRVPAGIDLTRRDKLGRLLVRSNPLGVGAQNANPLYNFEADRQTDEGDRVIGSVNSRYAPASWLAVEANLGFDRPNASLLRLRDRGYRIPSQNPFPRDTLGLIRRYSESQQSWNLRLNATASRSLGNALDVRWTAQYLVERQHILTTDQRGEDLVVPGLTNSQTARQMVVSSTDQSVSAIGALSGVSLAYRDRYVLDALFRRDGSSLFGADARWANYGRASASWRLTEEPWWFIPSVNELKLRASVGSAGGRPKFDAQYETYTIASGSQLVPNTLGNRDLRPELTVEAEYGLDAEVGGRVGINLNYAHSTTKDQILAVPPSVASGFSTQWQNAGTLENRTWEVSINVPIITRQHFSWSARLNYDRNRSEITALNTAPYFTCAGTPCASGTASMFSIRVGEQVGTIYGYRFITACSQLPDDFAAQCGPGREWQKNDEGLIVWVGAGNTLSQGITHNLWQAERFGCVNAATGEEINANGVIACRTSGGTVNAPNGVTNAWGNAILLRDSTAVPIASALGRALPDYRVSLAQTITWRRFVAYGLVDASVGNDVFNLGRHWSFGDFQTREQDQDGKTVETAKPLAHYWRAGRPENNFGSYGFYNVLGPSNVTVEDASYAKLREVSLGYDIGPVAGTGDWTVSVIGRNLFTATRYRGFDPEVGRAGGQLGSGVLNAVDSFQYPNIRSFTISLASRF